MISGSNACGAVRGLKVPMKQPKRCRLWLNDGSCVRLRPEYVDQVRSYDFVHHRTEDGRAYRTLNIIDEFSRECLAIRVKRKLNSTDVIDALTDLFIIQAFQHTSVPTTALSSSPMQSGNGSVPSALRLRTSSRARLGRTGTARASTPGSGTSY